jgi:hypothetical protein
MDDLFQNPHDKIETDPANLGPAFIAVMTSSLAKQLASEHQKPWTSKQETDFQEKVSSFLASCNGRGLMTFRVIVTRPSGQKVTRELDVNRISKTRSLQ